MIACVYFNFKKIFSPQRAQRKNIDFVPECDGLKELLIKLTSVKDKKIYKGDIFQFLISLDWCKLITYQSLPLPGTILDSYEIVSC